MGKIKALWNKFKQQLTTGNKWILWWVVGSILAMLVIHALFVPVGPDWLQARWGAGDLLTYVGTVSLSLLAVWQNKRFKEENDKAQERLERISQQANELTTISKILEHEERRINSVRASLKQFDDYSDTAKIVSQQRKALMDNTTLVDIAEWRKGLMEATAELLWKLLNDPFTDTLELRKNILDCLQQADIVASMLLQDISPDKQEYYMKQCDLLNNLKLDFVQIREEYISSMVKTYNHILYDRVSVQEICELRIDQKEEESN